MNLHIQTLGHGAADLVLLHGWAMHGGVFAPLLARLAEDFRLHVVDLPGHGHSRHSSVPLQLQSCVEALRHALPADALWCGWSLGGLVALAAARAGLPVRGLAMLCATPCFVRKPDWPHGMPMQVFEGFASGLREDWHATLDRFLALEAFGSDHAKEELRSLRDALFARGEPAPQILADGLALLEHSDLRADLASLPCPSHWIAGRRDRLVDPRAMQAAAALPSNAEYTVIEHAGHAPFLTHADQVAVALRALQESSA